MVGGVMTWTGEGDARAGGVMEGSGNLMCWGLCDSWRLSPCRTAHGGPVSAIGQRPDRP